MKSLWFSTYKILSVNRHNFISSFPIWVPFIFSCCSQLNFQYLIRVVRDGHLTFFLLLEEKFSLFHLDCDVHIWVFHIWILAC